MSNFDMARQAANAKLLWALLIESGESVHESKRALLPWKVIGVGESFYVNKECFNVGMANKRYGNKRFISRREGAGTRVYRAENAKKGW